MPSEAGSRRQPGSLYREASLAIRGGGAAPIGVLNLSHMLLRSQRVSPRTPGREKARREATRTNRIAWVCRVLVPVWLAVLGIPQVAWSQQKPSILLLPMVVHSSESPGYLRRGLSDMLMARFQQADQFVLIQVEDPAMATTQLDQAVEAGRAADADFVLFGSFTRFGEGASLDMHAASTSPKSEGENLREIFVHSGQIGEVIPDLEGLVGKVTRFAIEDFSPAAPGEDAAPPPVPGSRADLLLRVQSLEQALEQLKKTDGGEVR